jgi:hypothetical protein
MTVTDRVARWLDIVPASAVATSADDGDRASSGLSTRATAGTTISGRKSFDRPEDQYASTLGFFSNFSTDDYWRTADLTPNALRRLKVHKVVELLADSSPELSKALFDFVLMGNPGFTLKAYKPGTETEDVKATAALNAMLGTLKGYYGSVKVVFNRLLISAFLRGKLFAEIVLADNGRRFVDLATPDPAFLAFRRVKDPERGVVWQVGQWQGSEFVILDGPTIRYIPIHPFPGKIDGRSLVHPAIFICVFLIAMLSDLRRVVQQQGYPRLDIAILFEKLKDQIPQDVRAKPRELKAWADEVVSEIKKVYSKLKPDDTYVHSDAIEVNKPVGTLDNSSLGAVDGLIKACERMATRALKSMPLLMATTDGVSEANANRQWEMYAALCKSIQQEVETMVGDLFQFALQAQGIACDVRLKFAELRAAELFRDAQVKLLLVTIARAAYDNGWISQDEASQMGVEKIKADQTEPRVLTPARPSISPTGAQGAQVAADTQADPGANRNAMAVVRKIAEQLLTARSNGDRSPTLSTIEDALKLFEKYAPDSASSLLTAEPFTEQ